MIYYCKMPEYGRDRKGKHEIQKKAARKLLLLGLQREYGMAELPDISLERNGKPFFPDYPEIHFNYSHCRTGILCGIDHHRIGVDIENVREYRGNVAQRVCHPEERLLLEESDGKAETFIKLWVLKEAYVKYTGCGLSKDFREMDFSKIVHTGQGEVYDCFFKVWKCGDCMAAVCAEQEWDGKVLNEDLYDKLRKE